jgi:hypothetical protein
MPPLQLRRTTCPLCRPNNHAQCKWPLLSLLFADDKQIHPILFAGNKQICLFLFIANK